MSVSTLPVYDNGDVSSVYNDNTSDSDTFKNLREYRHKYFKNLILSFLNVNSLTRVFSELNTVLSDNLIDILSVGESKLDDSILDFTISVPKYRLYRNDKTRSAHGLATYVNSEITHCRRNDLEYENSGAQFIVIEMWLKKEKWFMVSTYKPPSIKDSIFVDELCKICDRLLIESQSIVILGDVNIDMKSVDSNCSNALHNFCTSYSFSNVVKETTCFKSRENESLIDVILVNNPKRFNECLVFDTGLSDYHKMISVSTKVTAPKKTHKRIFYRSMKKFDEATFCEEVQRIPFHISYLFDDIDDVAWCYESLLTDVIESLAPLKTRTLKSDPVPFMNTALRKTIHRRNQYRNRYWKNKSQENWEMYRKFRNKVNSLRRTSERRFFLEKSLSGTNSADFWRSFKPYLNKKSLSSNNIILKENDSVINKPTDVCNVFKDYYCKLADDIGQPDNFEIDVNELSVLDAINSHSHHPSILKIKSLFPDLNHFNFHEITSEMVLKDMKSLKIRKSCGYDNISPFFIKIAAPYLSRPFSKLINHCFKNKIFPHVFKYSETSPLFKAKDRHKKENYRPVSCPTIFSKMIEYQMNRQISSHFNDIFHTKLSAFRSGLSCEHVLINAVEDWKMALDQNKVVATLFMDLSKAFDCLPHKLLVSKFFSYGFSIESCCLIASYLSNRKMRVKHYGFKSEWCTLLKGVPQGSILGPTIYNIFVNDLLYTVGDYFYNYADDNSLAVIGDDICNVLSTLKCNAEQCTEWFSQNMMKANPDKFQFMILERNRHNNEARTIKINDITLSAVSDVKVLGVNIDDQLLFKKHVKSICNKASQNLNILYRLSNRIKGLNERTALAEAIVTSQFNYCSLVWHFCPKSTENVVESIRKRSLRFVVNDIDHAMNYSELLQKCHKGTFKLCQLKKIAVFVYKCYNLHNVSYLNELYKRKYIVYCFRDNNRLHVPSYQTVQFGYKSLMYTGSKLWNSLPHHVKESDTIIEFTSKLSQWSCFNASCMDCSQFTYHS